MCRVLRRDALVLGSELLDELPVGGIGQVGSPCRRALGAQRRVPKGWQRGAVDRRHAEQRHARHQSRLLVGAHEANAETSGQECVDRVGLRRRDSRDLGREVELIEGDVDLVHQRRRESALESANEILTSLVVRCNRKDMLVAFVDCVLAHCLGELVILLGDYEQIGRALGPRQRCGASTGSDYDHPRRRELLAYCHRDVRERQTDREIDLLPLDQLVGDLIGHLWLELRVAGEDLDGYATELAAIALDQQGEGVELVLTQRCLRTGELGHQGYLHLSLSARWSSHGQCQRRDSSDHEVLWIHGDLLVMST
ncbi:MAG: hypothetical protein U1E90_11420 [Burkholderiaceae bacterium]